MHDSLLSPAERASLLGEEAPSDEARPAAETPPPPSFSAAHWLADRPRNGRADTTFSPASQRFAPLDPLWKNARQLFDALQRPWTDALGQLTRTKVVVRLARFEAVTFGHLLLEAQPPTCFAVLHSHRWDGRAALEMEIPALRALIDRWLGGSGNESSAGRHRPTDIELRLATRLTQILLKAWMPAWPNLGPVDWEVEQLTTHPSRVRAWSGDTNFLMSVYELVLGDVSGSVRIAIPSGLLLPLLSVNNPRGDETPAARLGPTTSGAAEIVVSLRPTTMSLDDLAQLCEGDILTTDHAVDQSLEATFAGERPLPVRLGTLNGHLAVRRSH